MSAVTAVRSAAVRSAAVPPEGGSAEYDPLLDLIGNARLVGEQAGSEAVPATERLSHYFTVRLPQQFDAVIHLDRTTAVEPLDSSPGWSKPLDAPETYPSGV